jgi:hypothetical protein
VGKRHRRIRARSATGQVAGAATETAGLKAHRPKRPAQPAFSQKAPRPSRPNLDRRPDTTGPSREQFHAPRCSSALQPRRHVRECPFPDMRPLRAHTGRGPHRSSRTGSRDVFRAVTRTNAGHGQAVAPAPVTNAGSGLAMPAWHPADDACIRGGARACVAPPVMLALDEKGSLGAELRPRSLPPACDRR